MEKFTDILNLNSFGQTLPKGNLVLQQRLRLFKITTAFALIVFLAIILQVAMADAEHYILLTLITALFVGVFLNYFGLAVHKNQELAFTMLPLLLFGVLHVISYGQGGVRNSGMFYLAAIILTAYILKGKQGGILMACISIVHVIYFYFVNTNTNWVDYSLIGSEGGLVEMDFLITGTLSILVLTAQANYIEKSKNEVASDIERKRAELASINKELSIAHKDLEQRNRDFEQKNKELEQFAYIASHDLQEPLRTTTGFVELLQKQYKDKLDSKAEIYLDYILRSSRRMRVLITDLLEYSRIGVTKELTRIDCNEIFKDVIADLGSAIEETNAEIHADKLPVINGHYTEIKLLFQNLLFNAIKFRRKEVRPRLTISAFLIDNEWRFSFTDNGIGIAKEHSEKVFVIFQRLNNRSDFDGSGIGLSHCKKIVELYNGRIWFDSQPGVGTTFHFTIAHNNQ